MGNPNKEQLRRWAQEHINFVHSGEFDKIPPPTTLTPGDIVAIRANDLKHQVYDVIGDKVIVGYDKDEVAVRLILSIADIKEAGAFQTALLKFKGIHNRKVEVEGTRSYLLDSTHDN
jgi:hypothetical protein